MPPERGCPCANDGPASGVWLVRYGNIPIPKTPAYDWSVVRIYPLQERTQHPGGEARRENIASARQGHTAHLTYYVRDMWRLLLIM
eukprot:554288-Prorocentrum_minimum.AAC.1